MKTFLISLLCVFSAAGAFQVGPAILRSQRTVALAVSSNLGKDETGGSIYPRMAYPVGETDFERAKECAEHFGRCSVKEMKQLREELHQQRIQSVVFAGTNTSPEDTFESHLIEDELSLQLNLLNDESPPSYLFANDEVIQETDDVGDAIEAKVKEGEQHDLLVEMEEDGLLDSLAICALIGVLIFVPQLLQ